MITLNNLKEGKVIKGFDSDFNEIEVSYTNKDGKHVIIIKNTATGNINTITMNTKEGLVSRINDLENATDKYGIVLDVDEIL